MIHFFHVLLSLFVSCNLVCMESAQQIIPFLPYTIARSGTYTLAPFLEYNNAVRGDYLDSALKICSGANVVLNLQNKIFDAHGKKYAIDVNRAGSVFVYGGVIKNAEVIINGLNKNIQLIDVIIDKDAAVRNDSVCTYKKTPERCFFTFCNQLRQDYVAKSINCFPCVIKKSGVYVLSANVMDNRNIKKRGFDSAIRVFGKIQVIINLDGNTLKANGRTFGIDANGARSVFVCNGVIEDAMRAISSLKNDVWLDNITINGCKYSAIEVTPEKTHSNNVTYINCGDQEG